MRQVFGTSRPARSASRPLTWLVAMVVALAATMAAPGPAHAERPSREELRQFKQHVKKGSELRDAGEPWKALEEFEKAKKILDHPKLAYNIGKLRQKTGACEEAEDIYTDVLSRPKLPDKIRVEVVQQLKTTDDCKPHGTLSIACEPSSAKIRVGSHTLSCPMQKKVKPGDFSIVVDAPNHRKQAFTVTIKPGQRVERQVRLRQGDDPDDIVADNREGPDKVDPPTGGGEPTPWMRYGAYGAMGVGGALLLGGIISDYGSQSRAEEFVAANEDGDRKRAAELNAQAGSAQSRTIALYAAGAVIAGGGVALWVIDNQKEADVQVDNGAGERPALVRGELGWGAQGPTLRGVLRW